MAHSFDPSRIQVSGRGRSSGNARLPATTRAIDLRTVVLPLPFSPSRSVHLRMSPSAPVNERSSSLMLRMLVNLIDFRNIGRLPRAGPPEGRLGS